MKLPLTKTKTPSPADFVAERRAELKVAVEAATEAERKTAQLVGLREELERLEVKLSRFEELGDRRAEYPFSLFVAGFGSLPMEPLKSAETGDAMAAELRPKVEALRAQIAGGEVDIAELLA